MDTGDYDAERRESSTDYDLPPLLRKLSLKSIITESTRPKVVASDLPIVPLLTHCIRCLGAPSA